MTRCILGLIPGDNQPRCKDAAAPGFDYCAVHGERLGAFLLQMPGEREQIMREHEARLKVAWRERRAGNHTGEG